MSVAAQIVKDNQTYVNGFGDKSKLPLPPSRKAVIVTCMDARIDPAASLGIQEGEAHIIRNAGGHYGRSDALRSILISQHLLGTTEVLVMHHTDCGMLTFQDHVIRQKIKDSASSPEEKAAIGPYVDSYAFLPFGDLDGSVREDVAYLKSNPLLVSQTKGNITGWIYEVETGRVRQVV